MRGRIAGLRGVGVIVVASLACAAIVLMLGGGALAVSSAATPVKVNFQPAAAPVPAGYVVDSGLAFSDVRGFGWVTQASLSSAPHVGLDLSPNTRDRNLEADQRLDTLIHMQYPPASSNATAVKTPGAWEYALANGSYQVTVAVGDGVAGTDPENHVIHVEGVTAINGFVPSGANGSSSRHSSASVTVSVSDGRLTVDALGGTNTKLDYVDISPSAPDTTPPAAPAGVTATPGDTQVKLSWTANSESDLAGYNVYRSTSLPVPLSAPLNGASLLATAAYLDTGLANGTTYHYVVEAVDTSGNKAQAAVVSGTPQAQAPAVDVKVNFQDQATVPPTGYVRDFGQAYGVRTDANQGSGLSYGWVVPGTSTPLNLVGNGRNRNLVSDVRLNTLMHMQGNDVANFSGVPTAGAWEFALPMGTYSVTVSVGDAAANFDSIHRINVEGQVLVNNFVPTSSGRFASASKTVTVADGKLTLDAAGGKNTKLNYVIVTSATPTNGSFTAISWSSVAASPIGLAEGGGAVVNGRLYMFGGYYDFSTTPTAKMHVYDPATNAWSALAPLPQAATHMGVASDASSIYVAGGYPPGAGGTGQIYATRSVWRYDVATNTWSAMPSLPEARGGGTMVLLGRTLHYVGGSDLNRADRAEHWTLALDGGTSWTLAAALPLARNHLGSVVLNGKIYVVGGQRGQDAAAIYAGVVDVWDPAANTWTAAASLPTPRSHIAAATFVLDGRIIVIGGETSYGVSTAQVVAYSPSSNTWVQLTPVPEARHSGVGGTLGGAIYYNGGALSTTTYKGVPGS
jgi:N-acetylneuraminic acid mutarotase